MAAFLRFPCASSGKCERVHFGGFRQSGFSHRVYKAPWAGDPRVNIQEERGMAKAYQVRQILRAIEKIQSHENL